MRAQPLALLQPSALALPLPWLVDRYVGLAVERQRAIAAVIEKEGATMPLVRAHHDVLTTSRRIANVLARAGRTREIHGTLSRLRGLGADRELLARSEIVAEHPTATAFLDLARILRNEAGKEPVALLSDPAAALGACLTGSAAFPDDAALLTAAGDDARTLGRVSQPIALYERALGVSRDESLDPVVALRLGQLHGERIARLAHGGRPHAARAAWREVLELTGREAHRHPHVVWQQAAAIAESALGRGLAGQGLLADARRSLMASLQRAPSFDAYETLATLDAQTDHYSDAARWIEAGKALLDDDSASDRYRRAKLEQLVGDALRRAGRGREAAAHYLEGMRQWASLGETKDLPRTVAAERALDVGRMLWWAEHSDVAGAIGEDNVARAVESVLDAVELAPGNADTTASAIVFLIEAGRFREAVDAYYTGLGAGLSDFTKVYLSLWIVGAAKRRGETPDRLASEYLATRHGDTWYEQLARAASGRMTFAALAANAVTAPRRAELAFYGATLGFHPDAATPAGRERLLAEVVAARLVFDAEYDLARVYLAAP